ncbi:hypothetical protein NEMBOFW57_001989 [Staphylotrichum longicolle]|uniref:FAD-binding FR-type domain-containing protein n=1 Tax=Staphylotrichum longicolle TaxID=669026 RepID=A0AAD4I356_9PEZI|nr:hypothetical protein NEMBOFW57_001989 [Staphylotrichum longicolle]
MDRAQACLQAQGILTGSLPAFVRALCEHPAGLAVASEDDDMDWTKDPEKVEYIRQLLEALYEARAIVSCYNIVIVLVIVVLAVWHWRETRSDRKKWQRLREWQGADTGDGTTSPASSSSGTILGSATPPDAKDLDLERVPLLAGNRATKGPRRSNMVGRAIRSWLAHQPPPLPIVNRTLPSNGTSLFIVCWLGLNAFFHFFRLPMRWDFFFIFADRAGCIFVVNLPLLYLLSAKNQPLRHLTGYSYEALNIFHRRVGELLCFEGALHFVSMLLWQFLLARDWLTARSAHVYFTHPLVLNGIGALLSYELLYFTSLATFRQRWYELFLSSHVLLQFLALTFLFHHYHTARPYVALSLLIFAADRLLWRLTLKRATLTADLTLLDADTCLLSANWSIPPPPPETSNRSPFHRQSILHGWHPADHVFLTVPCLGRTHALQTHPFTIASAAPSSSSSPCPQTDDNGANENSRSTHAWLNLLIRAHDGFTRDLLRHARSHSHSHSRAPHPAARVSVRLDGPYGSPRALGVLRASGCAVLVAGGSGIAVVFPLVWALLHEDGWGEGGEEDGKVVDNEIISERKLRKRRVHLLWVTHAREHREWVPGLQMEELRERGLEVVMPEPTAEAGRPDVKGIVAGGWRAPRRRGGRAVRNVCAEEIGRGREVRVAVEKFGW